MRRRQLLAAFGALAVASPAFADEVRAPLKKAFPFLDAYLGVPAGERSRIYLVYRAVRGMKPATDAKADIVDAAGKRTPLAIGGGGIVASLPTLAMLKSDDQLAMQGAPYKFAPELRVAMPVAPHFDAAPIVAALAQANAVIGKIAGPMAMIVPKLTAAYLPDCGGGQALMPDGRAIPLPVFDAPGLGPVPYFEPGGGAKGVQLARSPSRILLGGHPKKT